MSREVSDFVRRRREAKARDIAQEVDPLAGGFFRQQLVRAALAGMEFGSAELTAPAAQFAHGKTAREQGGSSV
jgi:hypothetical protein